MLNMISNVDINMRYIIIWVSIVVFTFPTLAQESINWMTFEEAQVAQKVEKRKLFVDMYTDWCGWCKRMDATTFKNPEVVNYMNEHYYAVKFDAEADKPIKFNGKDYKLIRRGKRKYHELAVEFIKKSSRPYLSYPTFVFIDEDLSIIQPIKGYKTPEQLLPILSYFAGDYHKKMSWSKYQKQYSSKIKSKN